MKDAFFHFQHFSLRNRDAAFKINTDGVLLAAWAKLHEAKTILDIGTGTGVIAHICHYRHPKAMITAVDLDISSCEEAIYNADYNNYSDHISIVNVDVRDWNPEMTFDHIITNPPYFSDGTMPSNPKLSAAKHTTSLPSEALWQSISRLTHENSKVSLIIPFVDLKRYTEIAKSYNFSPRRILNIKNKSAGKYIRVAIEFSQESIDPKEEELIIHSDGDAYYSDAFIKLHQDLNMIFKS
jgi:tRNA1Val (adenine37-N6)-methyltransferase